MYAVWIGGLCKRKVNECHHKNIDFSPHSSHLLNTRISTGIHVYCIAYNVLKKCGCICASNSKFEWTIERTIHILYSMWHSSNGSEFVACKIYGRWWWIIYIHSLDMWISIEFNTTKPPSHREYWVIFFTFIYWEGKNNKYGHNY